MIEVSRRGRVAIARITHGKANAFDLELATAISDTFAELRTSADAAVVVTGQGAIFSAGVDLLRVVDGGERYVREFLPALSGSLEAVFMFSKPVVAAINGHAIAGGCILACAADYRIMTRGAGRIGVPELRVGVPFPAVPLEILRFGVPNQLEGLVYGGSTFSPEEALDHGIVDALADPTDLVDAAVRAAEELAALPPGVFGLTKRQVRGPAAERIRDGAALDAQVIDMWSAPQTIAGIRGYIARTFKK